MSHAATKYQAMDVQSMSGPRLVVFLYSHLVSALRQGERAIEARDIEGRSKALCRARDIVYELAFSLDRANGGEIAENLAQLYEYFIHEITQADLHPDKARLVRLLEMVTSLHQAWEQAAVLVAETPVAAAVNA